LLINGNQATATGGAVVASGATLGGTGILGSAVTMNNGSKLNPGPAGAAGTAGAVGAFQTGEVTFFGLSSLVIDIANPTTFDQLSIVGGNLNIGGAASLTLNIAPGTVFTPGLSMILVSNDGADAIFGTFSNAPVDGGIYTFSGYNFLVDYTGGDGNDLSIAAVPEPRTWVAAALVSFVLLGRLLIKKPGRG
jgi:hypothetical protein